MRNSSLLFELDTRIAGMPVARAGDMTIASVVELPAACLVSVLAHAQCQVEKVQLRDKIRLALDLASFCWQRFSFRLSLLRYWANC